MCATNIFLSVIVSSLSYFETNSIYVLICHSNKPNILKFPQVMFQTTLYFKHIWIAILSELHTIHSRTTRARNLKYVTLRKDFETNSKKKTNDKGYYSSVLSSDGTLDFTRNVDLKIVLRS